MRVFYASLAVTDAAILSSQDLSSTFSPDALQQNFIYRKGKPVVSLSTTMEDRQPPRSFFFSVTAQVTSGVLPTEPKRFCASKVLVVVTLCRARRPLQGNALTLRVVGFGITIFASRCTLDIQSGIVWLCEQMRTLSFSVDAKIDLQECLFSRGAHVRENAIRRNPWRKKSH